MDLISVALAVYEPDSQWLQALLQSINRQTYGNIRLLICDDGSKTYPYATLCSLVKATVTRFPFECLQNTRNAGSNAVFNRLTQEAKGDYIAYCDQDDIWEEDKLEKLLITLKANNAGLAYCDASVIDEQGRKNAKSITKKKPHIHYKFGDNLAAGLLTQNFVSGCTMLMRLDKAKEALPFPDEMIYDHWLTLWTAADGRIAYINEPLVQHRMHSDNQTSTLKNIQSKQTYYRQYLPDQARRMDMLHSRIQLGKAQQEAEAWMKARMAVAARQRGARQALYRLRSVNPKITLFELLLPWMPESLFRGIVKAMQRGKI